MRGRLLGMGRRLRLDAVLIGLIAILAVGNGMTGSDRAGLEARIARIKQPPSDLKVADRSRRAVQAVRTLDPHLFAWQVYLPPGSSFARLSTGPRIKGGDPEEGYEFTARVSFREVEDAGWPIDVRYFGQPVTSRLGNATLAGFLRGRWDQLIVEQAGRDGVLAVAPAGPVKLLRLSLPPGLLAEARAKLAAADWPDLPVLFEFAIEAEAPRP